MPSLLLLTLGAVAVTGGRQQGAKKNSISVAGNIEAPLQRPASASLDGSGSGSATRVPRFEPASSLPCWRDDLQQEVILRRAHMRAAAAFLAELQAGSRKESPLGENALPSPSGGGVAGFLG